MKIDINKEYILTLTEEEFKVVVAIIGNVQNAPKFVHRICDKAFITFGASPDFLESADGVIVYKGNLK